MEQRTFLEEESAQVEKALEELTRIEQQRKEMRGVLLRCELAEALRKWMDREGCTQVQAAKRLGVSQPRILEIARNKVEKLSLD